MDYGESRRCTIYPQTAAKIQDQNYQVIQLFNLKRCTLDPGTCLQLLFKEILSRQWWKQITCPDRHCLV